LSLIQTHTAKRTPTKKNVKISIMLNHAKELLGYKLGSLDGEIGKVKDFYFDDLNWTIRYLVADTGGWLSDRQVLISPYALLAVNADEKNIAIDLTKKQIKDSPSLDSDKPVSRQFEEAYYGHYLYPIYWGGPYPWGPSPHPARDHEPLGQSPQREKTWDHHLRSTCAVTGHHIQALDGEVGHVEDFIIGDDSWAIRYLVVDTHNWWPGRKALISAQWIQSVSWGERKVFVNLSREAIKLSPEYTEETLLNRDYEIGLHRHYKRTTYWINELAAESNSL